MKLELLFSVITFVVVAAMFRYVSPVVMHFMADLLSSSWILPVILATLAAIPVLLPDVRR